jgi:hypothetical protein
MFLLATVSYFFASKRVGGLAFQDPTIESDLQAIVQTIRILSSSDEAVAKIAREELRTFMRRTAVQSNSGTNNRGYYQDLGVSHSMDL